MTVAGIYERVNEIDQYKVTDLEYSRTRALWEIALQLAEMNQRVALNTKDTI